MTLRQLSAKPGEDPQTPSSVYATHSDDDEGPPREGFRIGCLASMVISVVLSVILTVI